jgi:signal transduction histidine kinase
MSDAELIEFLPDPVLLLSGGQTERANLAARDLAARRGVRPDLASLFGEDADPIVARAARQGMAHGHLALRSGGEQRSVFRVAIRRVGTSARFAAVLTDVSGEFAWREKLGARNRELAVLNEIGGALSSTLDLDTLAVRIYEQASRIMNTANFYVALHDPDTGSLSFSLRVENRERLPDMPPRPLMNGLTEYVLHTQQPRLLNGDVLGQAEALGLKPIGRAARSWLGVPLLAEGRAIGAIVLQDHEGTSSYDEHDLELLTLIAGQAAAAVRNARLLAQARDAYRELSETHGSLLETERLRGVTETVGALNHEVNNPLTAIAGNAQLLLRQSGSLPTGAEDKVKRILEAARRIQSVTSKMANLIHATSMPYPGDGSILDVSRSLAHAGDEGATVSAAEGGPEAASEPAEPRG